MFKMSFRLLKMKIGTHSGHFHADEALACFFLKQLPEFASAEIVRSRDNKILDTCDIVVDVGARFEPENKRFDHHQREFSETMKTLKVLNFETKLSSAGLIYAYYGKAVLSQMTGLAQDSPKLELIFEKVRKKVPETLEPREIKWDASSIAGVQPDEPKMTNQFRFTKVLLKNLMVLIMVLINMKESQNIKSLHSLAQGNLLRSRR